MNKLSENANSTVTGEQGQDPDLPLLECVRLGEKAAFEELYRRYFRKILRFAARLLRDTSHTEDVINETMYVVWNKAHSFDGSCRVSTWIFGIAFNKARRYSQLQPVLQAIEEEGEELEGHEVAASCSLELLENRELVDYALRSLSDEQRTVVELTYFHDFSYREIALIMQCSENTVKTRMFYARKKLYETISATNTG